MVEQKGASGNVARLTGGESSMLPWVLSVIGVIALLGIALFLFVPRRSRHIGSPGWPREHWEEQHEREKVMQQRQL
jgi:hypothetical protein